MAKRFLGEVVDNNNNYNNNKTLLRKQGRCFVCLRIIYQRIVGAMSGVMIAGGVIMQESVISALMLASVILYSGSNHQEHRVVIW